MPNSDPNELTVLLHGAGFSPIADRAFLRITGSDATRWLNGMVSNSIQALQPGEGNYNFLLNAQGRIQGDAMVLSRERRRRSHLFAGNGARATGDHPPAPRPLHHHGRCGAYPASRAASGVARRWPGGPLRRCGTRHCQSPGCPVPRRTVPPTQTVMLKQTVYDGAPVLLLHALSRSGSAF